MSAMLMQQANITGKIAVDHQVLAQNANGPRQRFELRAQHDWMAEPPQILSTRCARANSSGEILDLAFLGLIVAAELDRSVVPADFAHARPPGALWQPQSDADKAISRSISQF